MVFVEGKARFRLHGKMDLFVRPKDISQKKEQILRSETTLTSNVQLWIEVGLLENIILKFKKKKFYRKQHK
jgi:hypothetical protein